MIKLNKWIKAREAMYLILLFGYLCLNIYNISWIKLEDIIPYFNVFTESLENIVIPVCLGIMYITNLIICKSDRHIKTVFLQIVVLLAFVAVSVEYYDMLPLGMFLLCSHFTSAGKIAQTASFAVAFATIAVIVASQTGWTTDHIVSRFDGEKSAHYFGFSHYAIWARQLLFAAAAYLFARGKKATFIELTALFALNYAVFHYSTQRLTFVVGVILIAVHIVVVKFELIKINNKIFTRLAAIAFPVAFIGSMALHYFYNESVGIMAKLNTLLSTRLQLGKLAFELFDIKLFAQQVHGLTDYYFYIDCGYLYLLFAQGIILSFVVMFMYSYLYKRSCKMNNTPLFCWLTVALIYLLIDNTATNMNCTAVILLAFFSAYIEDVRDVKYESDE